MLHEIFYFLLIAVLYLVGCFTVSILAKKAGVTRTEGKAFSSPLEVLRGFAAFLVFGAHSSMYFGFAPKQVIAAAMGEVGVLLFFMLTGYLFWGQIQNGRYDAATFFKKRIYRLAPIMLVFITVVTALDWIGAGFPVPGHTQLLALLRNYGFGFGQVVNSIGNVNDVFSQDMYLRINNIWTLRWEWMFYLAVPLLATLGRFRNTTFFAVFLIILFMDPFRIMDGVTDIVFVMAFWFGALSFELEKFKDRGLQLLFSRGVSNAVVAVAVFGVFYYLLHGELSQKNIRIPILIFLVFPIFLYFVISQKYADRLTWAPMQLIGKISYSFYLWHLAVNYYVMRMMSHLFHNSQSVLAFITICTVMMLIGTSLSVITYRYVEEPFLKKSHSKRSGKALLSKANENL